MIQILIKKILVLAKLQKSTKCFINMNSWDSYVPGSDPGGRGGRGRPRGWTRGGYDRESFMRGELP